LEITSTRLTVQDWRYRAASRCVTSVVALLRSQLKAQRAKPNPGIPGAATGRFAARCDPR
jgi:hypothetical protein